MKYQVMPDLTPIEYEALKADIADRGILVPVEMDESGELLDGHHRIRAWNELRAEGVPVGDYPRIVRKGLTEEQKRNHARSLNVLRRQLSDEQRNEVMREMRRDRMPYQEIADKAGVSYGTAYNATRDVNINFDIENSRGQVRPASYNRNGYTSDAPAFDYEDQAEPELDGATLVKGPAGDYWQRREVRECATCHQLWAADLPYCPYCNISPEVRRLHADFPTNAVTSRAYPLTAANHAVSDDPDYDGDEWYTPADYTEAARAVLGGIDLDPASNPEANCTVGASEFYTKEQDGLTQAWRGRVFLNPPYSTPLIRHFVAKLISEYDAGNVDEAIILTNNSSDTAWFHDLLTRFPACFTRGRVQFWRSGGATFGARQGQTFFYLGQNTPKFAEVFSAFGVVVDRLQS